MINIIGFESHRDGIIFVECTLDRSYWSKYLSDHHLDNDEYDICLDVRFGKEPKIWLGYPDQEYSQLIEEKELINNIISKIESFKTTQNYRMDQFINFEANVRDWKIKNILK